MQSMVRVLHRKVRMRISKSLADSRPAAECTRDDILVDSRLGTETILQIALRSVISIHALEVHLLLVLRG